ncbi:Protein disulfide-isomerase [Glycine soja]|uniref:Uncharacterized protein n=2 Tax=Glycine subgen. Soja TaxID=1462606 RepID=K7KWJ5_SOYBN|nr:Protein disulfide-isomerase [Glycine soja]
MFSSWSFSVEEFDNFSALAEKLHSDYDFGHPLNVKLLPRGESSVSGPIVRLSKPFTGLFVDFQVFLCILDFSSFCFFPSYSMSSLSTKKHRAGKSFPLLLLCMFVSLLFVSICKVLILFVVMHVFL